MDKRKIQDLGKVFTYLKDPAFRVEEEGNATLVVENARFTDVEFIGQIWRNVRFINCDFIGSHQIAPESVWGSTFEKCRFVGIFNLGVLTDVRFLDCRVEGKSYVVGDTGSKSAIFKRCVFEGTSNEPNDWGSVGSYGEATFIECKAKWFDLVGYAGLTLSSCELTDVGCQPAGGKEGIYASVLIENTKLRGTFNMVAADLQSLTIRDTVLDNLDLTNATVNGDILMERVKGGYINVYVEKAESLSLRNSQIYGNGTKVFEAYAGGIRSIEIDTVTFGGDLSTEPVTIAGGTGVDLNNVRTRVSDGIIIHKSKVSRLSIHHVNTSLLQVTSCDLGSLDLSSGRITKLEVSGNTIAGSVDFTNTQAKESKVQALAKGQAKLDGSNIKTN